jgi:manganese oxidase
MASLYPNTVELQVGKRYRLRFICITPAPDLDVTLERGGHVETWRAVAKDGATLTPAQARPVRPATLKIAPGETYDFEFQPKSAGSLQLTAAHRELHATVPILVRPR